MMTDNNKLTISQAAIDMIIFFEVSSMEYYEKKLLHPIIPGLSSGITVGIGYDLKYHTKEEIENDWKEYLPIETIESMGKYSMMNNEDSEKKIRQARKEITIPFNAAISVFKNTSIPKWIKMLSESLPNCEKLNENQLGALVSIAYNRGCSFSSNGNRYIEMRNIKKYMEDENFDKISDEILMMRRLWPTYVGLQNRRTAEAKLFNSK